ncbi:MAG: TonB-dependent receptor plug domain-containing protein, partial [Cyclobacteriaceae bacterium]|nr:TonB-dependent receptor plug domain-containing protein [Cyclobacteriaceae bacterium]
ERLPLNKQSIPNSYGKPDFTISGEEIVKSSRTSLVDALIGRVPGLTVFNGYLRLGGPSNFQGPSTTEPMLIVDGTQFTSAGSDSNYGRLRQINPEIVERVDVIKYGGAAIFGTRGGNGVIVVTTKTADSIGAVTGPSGRDGLSLYKPIVGFSSTPPFYIPDYSRIANKEAYPDVRSTIYWAPFITTDNLGNAQISFYAAGNESRYKIVVEGVSAEGAPLRNVFYIQVVK